VYVFGGVVDSARGIDTDAVQRLDAVSGSVTQVARLPAPLSHATAAVLGGHVYLLGGYTDSTRLDDQILRFDPATRATTPVGHLPAPISDAAAVVIDGRIDVVGGQGVDRAPLPTVTIVRVR
jgi:N-acetylneuraminic acid mutarotase